MNIYIIENKYLKNVPIWRDLTMERLSNPIPVHILRNWYNSHRLLRHRLSADCRCCTVRMYYFTARCSTIVVTYLRLPPPTLTRVVVIVASSIHPVTTTTTTMHGVNVHRTTLYKLLWRRHFRARAYVYMVVRGLPKN